MAGEIILSGLPVIGSRGATIGPSVVCPGMGGPRPLVLSLSHAPRGFLTVERLPMLKSTDKAEVLSETVVA